MPKALPIDDFRGIWDTFDEQQQTVRIKTAKKRASKILHKQFKTSGVAILGKPTQTLHTNPIFQDSLKNDNVKVGEQLAHTALTSELLILDVVQIPRNQQKLYTGRSQYPKIKEKTIKVALAQFALS